MVYLLPQWQSFERLCVSYRFTLHDNLHDSLRKAVYKHGNLDVLLCNIDTIILWRTKECFEMQETHSKK
jgi:hypothetical protein